MENEVKKSQGRRIVLTLSWKVLSIVLIVALVALTIYTKPWVTNSANPRTITIKGEATIKRAPDSFVFNPTYEADTQEAITAKTNEVVAKVKELGLGDAGIQTQVSNYDKYSPDGSTGDPVFSMYLTLSVEDKELAQKIQDYLITTGATGQVTPTSGFTKPTQKTLRDEATNIAVQDARKRADSTASNLGTKVVKVIKVTEPDQMDGVYPMYSSMDVSSSGSGLPINAGESEFNYTVQVEFEIR